MADKIIIDGIDVSECQNYSTIPCWIGYIKCTGLTCSDIKDCYYKQLKRKEQELQNQEKIINKLIREHDNFKQECEKLKEENEKLAIKCMQNDEVNTFFSTPIDGWSDNPCNICESKQEYPKYKQALDEIENYVRDNSDFDKSDKLTSNTGAYDILEIINKEKDK